ncbi:chromate transporter [Lapidilactobacillus salsurivasis]
MLTRLWWTFLKIGWLGFGGGYAMLSLLLNEMRQLGLSMAQYADLNALDLLIPGPIAINSATYLGQITAGFPGALVATLAVCVPSMVLVPLFMRREALIRRNPYLAQMLTAVKKVSVGLIFAVAFSLLLSTTMGIDDLSQWRQLHLDPLNLLIMAAALWLNAHYKINPIWLTLGAGVVGWLSYYW